MGRVLASHQPPRGSARDNLHSQCAAQSAKPLSQQRPPTLLVHFLVAGSKKLSPHSFSIMRFSSTPVWSDQIAVGWG